jgi:hypothetical protein
MIDCSSLTKFGNMTSGGGLSQIFDNDITDTGYSTSTLGWAGVTLAAPTSISKVDVIAASNGFDASGSTSTITIDLYGKTGAAPTSATNGTKIGTSGAFTDVNSQITKTINSTSTASYDHVWVVISTGVWAVASTVNIFEGTVVLPGAPSIIASERYSIQRSFNVDTPLNWYTTEIPGFRISTISDEDAVATLNFRMDVRHNNVYAGAVGIAGHIVVRSGATWAACQSASFSDITNAVSGKNITDVTDHYGNINICIKYPLVAGVYYEFSASGSAHSSGSSSNGLCSILAEYGQGLNALVLSVDKGEVLCIL